MLSALLEAEFEGRRLDDEEIVTFVRSLLPAAAHTTTRTLGNLLVHLLADPASLAMLRADRSLVAGAANEALRHDPPGTGLQRLATHDVTIGEVTIPAGSGVNLVVGSGSRDEAVYDDPDRFDIVRRGRPVLAFGGGPHLCIGAHLARMEVECAIDALLDRCPGLRADPDVPPAAVTGITERYPIGVRAVWD
jgi:cytochrome P450